MARGNRNNPRREEEEEEDDDDEEENDIGEDGIAGGDDFDDIDEDDPLALLPDYVLSRVDRLQELHTAHEAIQADYMKERIALEKKFEALFQPLYADRSAIVQGEKDDEIAAAVKAKEEEEGAAADKEEEPVPAEEGERMKGIPQFWASAMTNHEVIGEMITPEDVDCLEHLLDVTCETREDGEGYALKFTFGPNEYFTNTVLTKTYGIPNLFSPEDDPMMKQVLGEPIDWKEGKSLTHKIVKKKQRGKGKHAGQVRTINKEEEQESFFHWFTPPAMPEPDDEIDEEEADRLDAVFGEDYDVAQAFRCHLIPNAVRWFANQADDDEDEEGDNEEEGEDMAE